jgi:hypothetical protein
LASASFGAGGAGAKTAHFGCVAGILPAIRGLSLGLLTEDALDTSGDDFNGTALDEQSLSMDQSVGDLSVSGFEDSAERLARNAHLLRGIGLIEAFEVGQADRLKFIDG